MTAKDGLMPRAHGCAGAAELSSTNSEPSHASAGFFIVGLGADRRFDDVHGSTKTQSTRCARGAALPRAIIYTTP